MSSKIEVNRIYKALIQHFEVKNGYSYSKYKKAWVKILDISNNTDKAGITTHYKVLVLRSNKVKIIRGTEISSAAWFLIKNC